jgi:nicotinamide mononucleotide (NMN) deamidase PncC
VIGAIELIVPITGCASGSRPGLCEEDEVDERDRAAIVQALHDSPTMLVLAVTGGGLALVTDLLHVAGASRTVLEVRVPYAPPALAELVGGLHASAVSEEVAIAMAAQCRQRAVALAPVAHDGPLWGVAATAALVTDRTRRGADRGWIALDDGIATVAQLVELEPGDRVTQDRAVADALLALIADR